MGLPLRNSTSFIPPSPGTPSLGGPSTTADSDLDPDLFEPLSYPYNRNRRTSRPSRLHPHSTSHHNPRAGSELSPRYRSKPNHNNDDKHTTHHHRHYNQHRRLHRHRLRQSHQTKPRIPWAADADEGRALARSAIQLPGERGGGRSISRSRSNRSSSSSNGGGEDGSQSSSSSSSAAGGRRPPSLERQDAFRDEKTAKRRRQRQQLQQQRREWEEWEDGQEEQSDDLREQAEVAELYRMGLLYDDEHERGEGFSLEGIVRDEPAYSLRVRRAKRVRREERERDGVSLSVVDLAFSVFGADETWAGWLLSGSGSGSGFASSDAPALEGPRPWMEAAHDTPRLTVVYELADDAVSAMSVDDDFLDSVSISEVSYCGGEEGDEMAWAMLDGCDGNATSATMDLVQADEDVDPWVVLGHDGS